VTSPLVDLSINLLAAGIGAAVTYTAQRARKGIRQRALNRSIGEFFGPPGGKIVIVHSAIFDEAEQAYNYPATDTRAARILAGLFEDVKLQEGVDFIILPDRQVGSEDLLWVNNIVLLCGPARNSCFRVVAPTVDDMRYKMEVTPDGRGNLLMDSLRGTRILSSRQQELESIANNASNTNFDYGLIASIPNFRNIEKRVVILAGIHGTGTVGAAQFVASLENLKTLNGRRDRELVCEIVRVGYDNDIETPTRIQLA
jgi:hypothetical protein